MTENIKPGSGAPHPSNWQSASSPSGIKEKWDSPLRTISQNWPKLTTAPSPMSGAIPTSPRGEASFQNAQSLDFDDQYSSDSDVETIFPEFDPKRIPDNHVFSPAMDQLAAHHHVIKSWEKHLTKFYAIVNQWGCREYVAGMPSAVPRMSPNEPQVPVFVVYLMERDLNRGFDKIIHPQVRSFVNEFIAGPSEASEIPIRYYEWIFRAQLAGNAGELVTLRDPDDFLTYAHDVQSRMGQSVSVEGSANAGTIFGFVHLFHLKSGEQVPGTFAIVCHHVATNLKQTLARPNGDPLLEAMQSPATFDHHTSVETMVDKLGGLREEISMSQGSTDQEDIDSREEDIIRFHTYQAEMLGYNRFDTQFGKVIWTSGLKGRDCGWHYPTVVDLALVKLNPTRGGINMLSADPTKWPERRPNVAAADKWKYNWEYVRPSVPGTGTVVKVLKHWDEEAMKQLPVIKFGRTTRLTQGELGTTRFVYTDEMGKVYSTDAIWASDLDTWPVQWPKPLSWGGDSGAPVINGRGEVIGMVVGATERRKIREGDLIPGTLRRTNFTKYKRDMTAFMRWDDIVAEIKESAEYDVKWIGRAPSKGKEPELTPSTPMPQPS